MNKHIFRIFINIIIILVLLAGAFFYLGCGTETGDATDITSEGETEEDTADGTVGDTGDETQTQVNFLVDEYLDSSFLSRIDELISEAFTLIPLAMAYHETQGYYELPFTKTTYDVDDSSQWTTDELDENIELSNLYSWPNVINLSLLYDEDPTLLNTMLNSLDEYDLNNLIDAEIKPALSDGSRIFLARDFITTLVRDDEVYVEVPYFLFINLDTYEISVVLELQGFNADDPFPDAPFIHDPHVEKLAQLLLYGTDMNGNLWQLCLRGNEKIQKFQAVVVSKNGSDEFDIKLMTSNCEDCCLVQKYQFNPPFYPVKKKGELIPVLGFGDKFDPNQNPNINLNNNLGQPAVGLAQGEVPGLIDENPIVPVPAGDTVITPGPETESASESGDELSGDPCCQTWASYVPSLAEIDCQIAELEKLKKSFEYWKRNQHGMENMDPVVQDVLDIQESINSNYALNQSVFYSEVWYGLAFDEEYESMVSDELDDLISRCDGCEGSSETVSVKENGATKTAETTSINCDTECDAEGACLYKNPLENADYTGRKDCLQDTINNLQDEIDNLNNQLNDIFSEFPQLRLYFIRSTIWDNIFFDGVNGIDPRAFCPSLGGPGVQDFGVDNFFHNVYLGIVTNNQGVDDAIDNAITQEMKQAPEAAGLIQCALGQLKQSLKAAYEKELQKRGYSSEEMEILLNKQLTPEEQAAVEQIQTLRKHINLKGLLQNKIKLALVNMDRKQAECAKTYMEKKHCELSTVLALMEGFRQSVASGKLDFGLEFSTNIPHCDICDEIQRLACCHGGNPGCTPECADYPANCCTDFEFPCGFMRYLICFGKTALDAGEGGQDVLFCPEFEYNNDPFCEGNTCMMEEICEDTCLEELQ